MRVFSITGAALDAVLALVAPEWPKNRLSTFPRRRTGHHAHRDRGVRQPTLTHASSPQGIIFRQQTRTSAGHGAPNPQSRQCDLGAQTDDPDF